MTTIKGHITLYRYTCRANGKGYIGTTNNLADRRACHANCKSRARAFNAAVKEHGIESFAFEVLAIFDNATAAAYHEQAAILKFQTLTPNGYNLMAGAPFTVFTGPHTAEHRANISTATKGRKRTAEQCARIAAANSGRMVTAETRAKLSAIFKGRTISAETRAKLSTALKGRTITAEARAKIGAANRTRVITAETRAKLSAASKAAWARKR